MRNFVIGKMCCMMFLFIACATTGGEGSGSSYIVTLEEIQTVNAATAYEILQRIRPGLLNRDMQRVGRLDEGAVTDLRQPVQTYVNGTRFGDKASLQNIDVSTIQEIHYYPPDEAIMKFGPLARGGVFDVTVR